MGFLCIFCHQVFPKDLNLKLHLRVHEKEVGCELCGKSVHNTKFSLHVKDCKRWPKIKKNKAEKRNLVEETKLSPEKPSTSSSSSTNTEKRNLVEKKKISPETPSTTSSTNAEKRNLVEKKKISPETPSTTSSTNAEKQNLVEKKRLSPEKPSTTFSTNAEKKKLVVMLKRLDTQSLKKYGIGSQNGIRSKNEIGSSKKIQCRLIQCLGCSRQYSSKMTMQRHYKIVHLNEKFQCDKCDKSFTDSRSLRDHRRSQHMGVFYKCEPCGKQFNVEISFTNHAKKCLISKNED